MMEEKQEMELSYVFNYSDYKKMVIRPVVLFGSICFIALPVFIVSIFELIMFLLNLQTGYSEFDILLMITIPIIFGAIIVLFFIITPIVGVIFWKSLKKLPQEEKWTFNQFGITYDKIYVKRTMPWVVIGRVQEYKNRIMIFLSDKPRLTTAFSEIPKRIFDDEQLEEFYNLLKKYLGESKLKFKSIKESKQNI